MRSELCFTHLGFNPSKVEDELKVGTGGCLVERKCQITHHHHVLQVTHLEHQRNCLSLSQSYLMVNFITGRS